MQPPPQPMVSPPPAQYQPYAYAPTPTPSPLFSKRMVFVVIGLGALLILIAQLALRAFTIYDTGTRNALEAIGYVGAFLGFGGSLVGALGCPQTDGHQNLGLLVLTAFFLTALLHVFG